MTLFGRYEACVCRSQADAVLPSQRRHRPHWYTGRWAVTRTIRDRLMARWSRVRDVLNVAGLVSHGGRFYGGTYWPSGFDKPRTCSYCGGIHPHDAIILFSAGWEVEGTDKGYKRYLHPPGCGDGLRPLRAGGRTGHVASPVPPVKLYLWHFSDADIVEWNRLVDSRYPPAS